jgi:hypothetical protein
MANNFTIMKNRLTVNDALESLQSRLGRQFADLARRTDTATELSDEVKRSLPEEVRPHVITAVRRGADVVVVVDSAAWTARVRYAAAELQVHLAAIGTPVSGKVRVRVGRRN